MKLAHKIDPTDGFYIEDIIYQEEWSEPTPGEQGSAFTPVLLNPIDPAQGLVSIQPIGFHKPKWDFTNNEWIEGDTTAALDRAKQSKLQELKQSYTEANNEDIAYMNTTFQADTASQSLIVSVLSAGVLPTGFFWLDTTNNQVPMTYTELQGLSGTILTRNQTTFIKYQGLKSNVIQATTPEAINLINW